MKWLFLVALAILIGPPQEQYKAISEIEALQGTWVLKTIEQLGEITEQDPTESPVEKLAAYREAIAEERELAANLNDYRTEFEVKGNSFVWREYWNVRTCGCKGRVVSTEGAFRLDTNQSPMKMTRYFLDWRAESIELACLFEVKGDTLKWCISLSDTTKAPTRFASDEEVVVYTFKRLKK